MASAQVLRKQEHLEAGKKKLEEFRRKKAAEKAKKATSTAQLQASDGILNDKQTSDVEQVRATDLNGVGTYGSHVEGHLGPSGDVSDDTSKKFDSLSRFDLSSSSNTTSEWKNGNASSFLELSRLNSEEIKNGVASLGSDESITGNEISGNRKDYNVSSAPVTLETANDRFFADHVSAVQMPEITSTHSSNHDRDNHLLSNMPERIPLTGNSEMSTKFASETVPKSSISSLLANRFGNSAHSDNYETSSHYPESLHSSTNITNLGFGFQQKVSPFLDAKESFTVGVSHSWNTNQSSPWRNDRHYDYNSDAQNSLSHGPPSPPAAGRRSRPSFLDSIQISRGPSLSPPVLGAAKDDSSNTTVYPVDGIFPSVFERSANSSIASGDGLAQANHIMVERHDFLSRKHNEDFAALEQHIEDLTQEKFSLQRALEASRTLAESLASENSALTDSFNQQGGVVNQLKSDIEKLQEEIKAQLVLFEAVQVEYANAQMECNAADERAKLLASEVIGLEEKVLRLRSNELKLERQLESAEAELSSYRKKLSSLDKDRQDLQSTIDALKEEKKLLQSKLRKASSSGKSLDLSRMTNDKKDMSTSTEDLDMNRLEPSSSENLGSPLPSDDTLSPEALATALPSDQIRMIQNINVLIAELALEKEQLVQALATESSQSQKLLELNKELSRKLEAQTQRLELLTAQSMANDSTQLRQSEPRTSLEAPRYADEGDEVVERVLGWILKLFPGGPSRRRTTKHL